MIVDVGMCVRVVLVLSITIAIQLLPFREEFLLKALANMVRDFMTEEEVLGSHGRNPFAQL